MKPQDILFLMLLIFFIWKRNAAWAASVGLACLFIAIPLFATWTFFTAERLTWYAAAFFLLFISISLFKIREK